MSVISALPEQERISDTVFATLRQAIFTGELAPGDRLSVPSIAEQLRVSRSPVREAVQRLVQDGLAVEEARRGAAVASISPAEIGQLYETREVLEGLAARLAASRRSADALAELTAVVDEHRQAVQRGDNESHLTLDMKFHALLRAIAGNGHLSDVLDKLQNKIAIGMLSADTDSWPKKAVCEHARILDAIRAGKPELAEQLARAHIVRVRTDLENLERQ